MVLDPVSIALITSAISAGTQGGIAGANNASARRAAKRKAKETKRETLADLFGSAAQTGNEMEAERLANRGRSARRRSQSLQDSSEIVRGALTP